MKKDYETLGVPLTCTLEEIKKAYHKLALRYHPDVNQGNSDKFNDIKEAYDRIVKNYKSPKQDDFNNLFSEIFSSFYNSNKKQKSLLHTIKINLNLKEAISGTKKTLNVKVDIPCTFCSIFTRTECKACKGLGYTPETFIADLELKNIKIQNQEFIFKKIYKDIDLKVITEIKPLDNLRIKGKYLEIDEELNIFKAIAGGNHTISTPLGSIDILLPYGNISNFYLSVEDLNFPWNPIKINFKLFLPETLTTYQKSILNSLI